MGKPLPVLTFQKISRRWVGRMIEPMIETDHTFGDFPVVPYGYRMYRRALVPIFMITRYVIWVLNNSSSGQRHNRVWIPGTLCQVESPYVVHNRVGSRICAFLQRPKINESYVFLEFCSFINLFCHGDTSTWRNQLLVKRSATKKDIWLLRVT